MAKAHQKGAGQLAPLQSEAGLLSCVDIWHGFWHGFTEPLERLKGICMLRGMSLQLRTCARKLLVQNSEDNRHEHLGPEHVSMNSKVDNPRTCHQCQVWNKSSILCFCHLFLHAGDQDFWLGIKPCFYSPRRPEQAALALLVFRLFLLLPIFSEPVSTAW